MIHTDLLRKYPDLIDRCRDWDCGYTEAINRIDATIGLAKNHPEKQLRLNEVLQHGGLCEHDA